MMARLREGDELRGPVLRRVSRIGGVLLAPRRRSRRGVLRRRGAVVMRDVAARAIVMGVPARVTGVAGDAQLLERWR
jgi:acetyltransferase-like isoleucine patch superfamily enzyme